MNDHREKDVGTNSEERYAVSLNDEGAVFTPLTKGAEGRALLLITLTSRPTAEGELEVGTIVLNKEGATKRLFFVERPTKEEVLEEIEEYIKTKILRRTKEAS